MRANLPAIRRAVLVVSLLLGIAVLATAGYQLTRIISLRPQEVAPLPDYGQIPDFSLEERSGRTVSLADLRGKVWVVDFVFTTCPGPCPVMTSRMKHMQDNLINRTDVRLVSITVDPETDTPEVLTNYANAYGADPQRWLFLTGSRSAIRELATTGLHLAMERNPDPASIPSQGLVVHSTRFVLVDGQGHNRGYYDSTDSVSMRQLMRDIGRLLKAVRS